MEDWILVNPDDPNIIEMFDYTLAAITVLGFRNGAAVSEVKLTSKGPALIETGARLNGPTMERQPYLDAGLNGTQATALASSLVTPDDFEEKWAGTTAFQRPMAFAKSFFIFKGKGEVRAVSGMESLKKLTSWHSNFRPLSVGDEVVKTIDTVGRGGVCYWINSNIDELFEDLRQFRTSDDHMRYYSIAYD